MSARLSCMRQRYASKACLHGCSEPLENDAILHCVHYLQVYGKLAEKLGLSDHLTVLNVMLGKIATNLKVYGSCDDVIESTLTLFQVSLPSNGWKEGCSVKSLGNAGMFI